LLAVLTAAFFGPLALRPDGTLYSDHSDLLAHYLPAKHFLTESWRETGEPPLWCSYSLGGMPFIHDPQVGAFYPPHWLLLLVPSDALGAALSWFIVAHLLIAGWGTYACARDEGLYRGPALVAAIGFLFAGKWLLHLLAAGHYTTIGLAWMPWALFCLHRAQHRLFPQPCTQGRAAEGGRSDTADSKPLTPDPSPLGTRERGALAWATSAGVCFALVILGTQPQWAFYAGIFLAVWTLGVSWDCRLQIANRRLRTDLQNTGWRLAGIVIWAAVIALALSAVQWLPTLEAAALSTRGGGVASEDVLGGGLRALMFLVGPALTTEPANLAWEDRGGFGLLWLVAAALTPLVCKYRVGGRALACAGLIAFGVGGAVLVQWLPGFRLFRQPTRMLLIAALPVALLAGETTQALLRGAFDGPCCRRILVRISIAAGILAGGFAVRQMLQDHPVVLHPYWITLAVTLPAAYWVLGAQPSTIRSAVWGIILLVDLWALTWPLVQVRPESEVYTPSPIVLQLLDEPNRASRVLDVDSGEDCSPLGRGAPLALLHRLHAVRGYNPLDVRRTKEYLQKIAGDDAPLRPFEHPLAFPIIGDAPVQNRRLFNLFGVRYLLQPTDKPMDLPGWRKIGEDSEPEAYDVIAGGRRKLPAYNLYENVAAMPRVFVVPRAVSSEDFQNADVRNVVVLDEPITDETSSSGPGYWSAAIEKYQPNKVTIQATGDAPGWLVFTDIWYPGWKCSVDGAPAKVYRGDLLFRTVHLEPGLHEVVFRFEPESFRWGRTISLVAVLWCFAILWIRAIKWTSIIAATGLVGGGPRHSPERVGGQ
jgi:hypothetical protein